MPKPHPFARPPAPEPKPPLDLIGALTVLFPGIDIGRDVEVLNEGSGPFIHLWHLPQPQPTLEELEAVVIPLPDIALDARQARLWLLNAGISLAAVEARIAAIPDAMQRDIARVDWEYGPIHLSSPLVQSIGAALGLDAESLRAAFTAAQTL